jgi:hypothetical protein
MSLEITVGTRDWRAGGASGGIEGCMGSGEGQEGELDEVGFEGSSRTSHARP